MTSEASAARGRARLGAATTACGVSAIAVGAGVLVGWASDVSWLKTVAPGLPTMKALTALAVVLLGAAILLLGERSGARLRRIGALAGWVVAGLGVLVLGEYLFGGIGIDEVLIDDTGSYPGRPSPLTAVALVVLGTGLGSLDLDPPRYRPSLILVPAGALVVIAALVGYLYDVDYLRGVSGASGMAIHTVAALAIVCAGLFLLRPDRGLAGLLRRRDDTGAHLARRLVPAVILVPLLLGLLRLQARDSGLVADELSSGLVALATICVFVAIALYTSWRISETEAERRALEAIVRKLPATVYKAEPGSEGRWHYVSPRIERLLGYTPEEWIANPRLWTDSIHPDDRGWVLRAEAKLWAERPGAGGVLEYRMLTRDGDVIWVHDEGAVGEDGLIDGVLAEITARKAAEQRFRALLEAAPDATVVVNDAGRIAHANPRATETLGYTRDELLGRRVETLIPKAVRAAHAGHRERYTAAPEARPMGTGLDLSARRKDGSLLPVEISLSPVETDEGTLVIAGIRDITERKRAERALREAEQRFRSVFEQGPVGIALVGPDLRFLDANEAFCAFIGYTTAELRQMTFAHVTHPDDVARDVEEARRVLRGEIPHFRIDKRYVSKSGQTLWADVTVSTVRDEDGEPLYNIAIVEDISDRKRFEDELRHLAEHDPLTDLPNRRRFGDQLERTVATARRYGAPAAVLQLDLDDFKEVNDTRGHPAGDELLVAVSRALAGRLRETDVLARLGGDEFGVILPYAGEEEARTVADALLAAIRDEAGTTASVGIALIKADPEPTASDALARADIAMYRAKAAGRGRIDVFTAPATRD